MPPDSQSSPRPSVTAPRYELHFDQMDEAYSIRKVEEIGPFKTRADARQYMIDRSAERKAAMARV